MDFFDSKLNLILSNWNPINVPHDIAITEYSSINVA